MIAKFSAFRIHCDGGATRSGIESLSLDDLCPGAVVIRAAYSSVNYKDALAATGTGKILRRSPLVGGVDVSGIVESSSDSRFKAGDSVLVTGCGLSEVHDGGYSEYVRVSGDWVIMLPDGLDLYQSMALGTAGFTAALAVQRMERNGQHPELGPIIITGATGGVGSFAINFFSNLGYEVVAMTGKPEAREYLQELGAGQVLDRHESAPGYKPLEQGRWGGAVDCVGGETLGWLTRTVRKWGNIASIGMAGGSKLHTTVMPFIVRGVSLLGISSANCPMPLRRSTWQRLTNDLQPTHLQRIATDSATLDTLPAAFQRLLQGKQIGRTVVTIAPP